jgi:hypothetical protein
MAVVQRFRFRYHVGTVCGMDVSIKGLEPEVVARLAEQAEIEGVSQQEWMRQSLRRTASLLTPTELGRRAGDRAPFTDDAFRAAQAEVARRRASAVTDVHGRGR